MEQPSRPLGETLRRLGLIIEVQRLALADSAVRSVMVPLEVAAR
ncbi:hypothetical protein [Streptomyces sp. NPDC005017]